MRPEKRQRQGIGTKPPRVETANAFSPEMLQEGQEKVPFPQVRSNEVTVIDQIAVAHKERCISVDDERRYAEEQVVLPHDKEAGLPASSEGGPPRLEPRREHEHAVPLQRSPGSLPIMFQGFRRFGRHCRGDSANRI